MSHLHRLILSLVILLIFVAQPWILPVSAIAAQPVESYTSLESGILPESEPLPHSSPAAECAENSQMFDHLPIPTYVWSNGHKHPEAIVLGIHGGCLHGRAYAGLADALVEKDYLFVSMDMHGYGKWHFNHFGTHKDETFNYPQDLKDIEAMLRRLRIAYPHTPIYCIGESLGGNIALIVASQKPGLVDGIVLVSPYAAIKLFVSARMLLNVAQVVSNPASKINLSPYFRNRLSNRPERVAEHFADPLSRDRQSARELLKSLHIDHRGIAAAMQVPDDIPMLMIIGKQDVLVSPKAGIRLFNKLTTTDKQLWVRPNSAHLMVETKTIDPVTVETISRWIHRSNIRGVALKEKEQLKATD